MLPILAYSLSLVGRTYKNRHVLTVVAVVGTALVTAKLIKKWWKREEMKKKRTDRQRQRQRAEEVLAQQLKDLELSLTQIEDITTLPIQELQEQLQNGKLRAIDVIHAFQSKAIEANKKTNAITGYIQEAEEEARQCDQIEDRSQRLLHGIPVSIKECFPIKGYDCTVGISQWIGKNYTEDCVLVKVLRHQGAIPFARTNVPQTMISFDSCNPIYGQTLNPYKSTHSAGGSTGGEAALLASGGSVMGLAGDIGGSIRMPSAFCGTYGLKPTSGRFSSKGTMALYKGQNLVQSAYGPMANSVEGLILMMKAVLCPLHFQLDKSVPNIPFKEQILSESKKPKLGFYFDDGFMKLTPMMRRTLQEAISALRSIGYEVIEWKFPDFGRRAAHLYTKALLSDGGKEMRQLLKYDILDHSYINIYRSHLIALNTVLYTTIRKLLSWIWPNIGIVFSNFRGIQSIHEWQQLTRDINAFRQEVEDDLREKNIDAILAPGFTMPAPPVGQHRFATGAVVSTAIYNCLDFPAGSMPVSKVTADDITQMADYPTPDPWHYMVKKMCMVSEGLPLNVQVASMPWREEVCLKVMKDLDDTLKARA